MPYEDEEPAFVEVDAALNALSGDVIGAAIEVHRRLGAGLDEALYEAALCIELRARGIDFVRQAIIQVSYRGELIGEKKLDLIIDKKIVLELKAVDRIAPVHEAQLLTYLRITGHKLGLLINFNVPALKHGIKRVINTV